MTPADVRQIKWMIDDAIAKAAPKPVEEKDTLLTIREEVRKIARAHDVKWKRLDIPQVAALPTTVLDGQIVYLDTGATQRICVGVTAVDQQGPVWRCANIDASV